MKYVNINTQELVQESDIRGLYPTVSFPNRIWTDEDIQPFGFATVKTTEPPVVSRYEKLVEKVILDNGQWILSYDVVPMDAAEIALVNQELEIQYRDQTQMSLDNFARTRGYDNVLSLTTYATSSNLLYQKEGARGVELRDATWTAFYNILDQVKAGLRPMPESYEEIRSELPILTWSE